MARQCAGQRVMERRSAGSKLAGGTARAGAPAIRPSAPNSPRALGSAASWPRNGSASTVWSSRSCNVASAGTAALPGSDKANFPAARTQREMACGPAQRRRKAGRRLRRLPRECRRRSPPRSGWRIAGNRASAPPRAASMAGDMENKPPMSVLTDRGSPPGRRRPPPPAGKPASRPARATQNATMRPSSARDHSLRPRLAFDRPPGAPGRRGRCGACRPGEAGQRIDRAAQQRTGTRPTRSGPWPIAPPGPPAATPHRPGHRWRARRRMASHARGPPWRPRRFQDPPRRHRCGGEIALGRQSRGHRVGDEQDVTSLPPSHSLRAASVSARTVSVMT